MIVEDDRHVLEMMFVLFMRAGFSVLTAENGQQALDLLERGIHPKLIVLDLVMPKVTGWQVLEYLRGDKELRDIRVIITTAVDASERERGRDRTRVVADLVLEKPINFGALVTHAQRLLGMPSP